jgi:regulator of sigma E protease
MIAQLISGLALLVFVHELGHFLAARFFKIRVPKFYLFFNPAISLVRCKRINGKWQFRFFAKNTPSDFETQLDENGQPVLDDNGKPKQQRIDLNSLPDNDWRKYPDNTEYGVGWLPLGGYCQIAGMIDETQSIANMPSEPQAWEYRSRPAWQKLIVILGGIFVNLVIGVLLYAMVIGVYEKEYIPNAAVTDGIYAYQAARNLHFECGDKIVEINGKVPERLADALSPKMYFGSVVRVERNGKQMDIVLDEDTYSVWREARGRFISAENYPAIIDSVMENGAAFEADIRKGDRLLAINDTLPILSRGALFENIRRFPSESIVITLLRNQDTLHTEVRPDTSGLIGVVPTDIPYETQSYSLSQIFVYGWKNAMTMLTLNIKGIGRIISGKENARDLSGPIGIAQVYGGIWNWWKFWEITALLSVVLAFMNVLPIPGLDGGHAIFAFVELITRRKVSDKVLQSAQTVGMLLLLLLMVFVIGNDIFKLFM